MRIESQSVENSFRGGMLAGRRQVGIRSQLCSSIAAEALGRCGFDYVYLDMEHSPNDLASIVAQCQSLAGTGTHAVVRMPSLNTVLIQQLLDQGVENIVIPMVESADEARGAVAVTRYPPRGVRSVARVHRGNAYGAERDYALTIDQRICLIVQVESRNALANIDAIAGVDGVHGVLIGPGDLAADLGHLGQADHPDVVAAITAGVSSIRAAGKFAGMSTTNPASAPVWFERGCQFISVGGDLQLLVEQARRAREASAK